MAGPLDGFRIVDATQMISGPMATMTLGDQGADVIKIEPPGIGDLTRALGGIRRGMSPTFAVVNRNKRSVVLNLHDPRGLEALKRIVARADLFIQNFRPGVADRMGIGYDALRAVRPDLVYVSISGFGESGPYAGQRVYDPVIQALSGLADIQSDADTGRPRMMRLIIPDKVTALTAAQAMTAALLARERTGRGQHVRLAMLDAVIAFEWPEGMAGLTFVEPGKAVARPAGTRDLIFETADGYITAGAISDAEWAAMCRALERPEWLDDDRFNTPAARVRNADARLELTAEVVRTHPSAYWLARMRELGVPCAPVLRRVEVLANEQVRANRLIVESIHPHAGAMREPRPAPRFEETPAELRRHAPILGEHTDEVLAEAGISADEIATLRAAAVAG
ncbi:MAG TPA: CoA transferase [Candidatus Binataceae bacterium]|nr:CoA transferase [Candidatus Binataceae bacterium]